MDRIKGWFSRPSGARPELTPEEERAILLRIAASLEGPGAVEREMERQAREIEEGARR